jgi:hypothetical protein
MKRCPQCEFIYEDNQSHCDMDGTRLTHDSHQLPKLQALTARSESLNKPKWRSRIIPLIATVILASVLALVYYVSIRSSSRRSAAVAIPPTSDAPANSAGAAQPPGSSTLAPPESTSEKDAQPNPEAKSANDPGTTRGNASRDSKPPEAKPSPKPNVIDRKAKAKQQAQTKAQPRASAKPAEKDESKVRSIWRKTGRFLKKTLPL